MLLMLVCQQPPPSFHLATHPNPKAAATTTTTTTTTMNEYEDEFIATQTQCSALSTREAVQQQ
jgi:hypothetical protein